MEFEQAVQELANDKKALANYLHSQGALFLMRYLIVLECETKKLVTEKNANYAALVQAAREVYIFLTQADFDFRNGNEAQGVDEGEYYGRKALNEICTKLAALLPSETQEQKER